MTKELPVYEYDNTSYRVVWEEPDGKRRYSKHYGTESEARIHATTHHQDWPWAITRETDCREVVLQSTDLKGK